MDCVLVGLGCMEQVSHAGWGAGDGISRLSGRCLPFEAEPFAVVLITMRVLLRAAGVVIDANGYFKFPVDIGTALNDRNVWKVECA